MDKKGIVRVLGPGLAAAAVVLLVGLLVITSDWKPEVAAGPVKQLAPSSAAKGKGASVDKDSANDVGMSDTLPPADAPEWKDLGDGLKMWDVKVGTGDAEAECPPGANVTIHYTGWTLDGRVFDGSRPRGAPTPFGLGSLIRGWQLGIPGMKPGGVRRLLIPGPLAYGSAGMAPKIGPNATLIFEVKLLGFN